MDKIIKLYITKNKNFALYVNDFNGGYKKITFFNSKNIIKTLTVFIDINGGFEFDDTNEDIKNYIKKLIEVKIDLKELELFEKIIETLQNIEEKNIRIAKRFLQVNKNLYT